MTRPPGPPERRVYRRRRAREASKLLPVVGLFLFLLPLLRSAGSGPPLSTALGGLYLFGVWAGLIAAALIFAVWLPRGDGAEDRDGPER